jgi:hypothetical protein
MKTLKNHLIFYDEVCPMCNLYTGAFVRSGMLDRDGRTGYQNMPADCAGKVDCKRAVDEIALLNKDTGEVYYGINSLFLILGNSFPVFKPLFRIPAFAWLMKKLYKFISYNRRVIMPSAESNDAHNPAFNRNYRLLYLFTTWILTALILFYYSKRLEAFIPASNFYREFIICGGQMIWQLAFISLTNKKRSWDYLGTMMTISFAGGILLLLMMGIAQLVTLPPVAFVAYFLLVAGLMLLEHIRRTRIMHLASLLSVTWVLYRIILLFIITNHVQ